MVRGMRRELQRLKVEFLDSSFMSQQGMSHLMEQRIRDVGLEEAKM